MLTASRSPWLSEAAAARLRRHLDQALRQARRRGGPVLASVSERLRDPADPSALVLGSRRVAEPWMCFEQPDRDGFAVAGIGCATELSAAGADRFAVVSAAWRKLVAGAAADPPAGPAGAGLAALGGFGFTPDRPQSAEWEPFGAASLVVPEIAFARGGGCTWLTVSAAVDADDLVDDLEARLNERLAAIAQRPLPLLDPSPTGTFRVRSAMPPSHYEEAVARAVDRIRDGQLDKIVLAREVEVEAPVAHDPAAIYAVLRDGFPSSFVYAVGRGEATFIGATPELLVRRQGQRASTVALAGSTRRSADPAVDDHLGEQLLRSDKDRHENAIVARRIVRALQPLSIWVTAADEPVVIKVANIQHLAAPIRAQLAEPVGAFELADLLHPTPAVGGEPGAVAQRMIPSLEGFERGWYAGAVGWVDAIDDGEFCVALRCALLRGRMASCYAGCGIVGDSNPASELAETEVKLQALLPVLAG